MSNEKTTNTTEVIIIPNDKMHSENLSTMGKKCRDDRDCNRKICDFIHAVGNNKFRNLFLKDNVPTEELISYLVEDGFIVMIHRSDLNILEVYFPSLSFENVSINQLCQFSKELKKKEKVSRVLGYRWDSKKSVLVYNDEFSCNFYKEATGNEPVRLSKKPAQDKPIRRCLSK